MTRLHLTLIVSLIAVTLTGCLQSATTIIVKKDGTAQIVDSMLYTPRFIGMMESMSKMGKSDSAKQEVEKFVPYDDESIREDASDFGTGVTLDHWDEITVGSKKGYVAYYNVSDISKLSIEKDRGTSKIKDDEKNEAGESPDGTMAVEEVEDDGALPVAMSMNDGVLTIINPLEIPDGEEEVEVQEVETSDEEQMKMLDMMSGFMKGLKFSVKIQVDGEIESTNATYVDGSTLTLILMDFDKMIDVWENDPETFKNFDKVKDKDIANFKELLDAYPDGAMQMEFVEKITVKF